MCVTPCETHNLFYNVSVFNKKCKRFLCIFLVLLSQGCTIPKLRVTTESEPEISLIVHNWYNLLLTNIVLQEIFLVLLPFKHQM